MTIRSMEGFKFLNKQHKNKLNEEEAELLHFTEKKEIKCVLCHKEGHLIEDCFKNLF
jgi:hypothetical protein